MFHLQDLYDGDQNLFRFLLGLDSISTLVLLDRNGNVVDFNEKFLSKSGSHPGDLLGKPIQSILNSDLQDGEFWTDFKNTIQSAGVWRGQLNWVSEEHVLWVDALACVPPNGIGILVLLFDSFDGRGTRNLEPVLKDVIHSLNNWISVIFATADMMKHKVSVIESELDPSTIEFFNRRIENLETSINNGNLKIQQIRKLL